MSVALHAAVIVAIGLHHRESSPIDEVPLPVAPVEPAPVEISLWTPPSEPVRALAVDDLVASHHGARAHAVHAHAAQPPPVAATPVDGVRHATPTGTLAMRTGPDLALHELHDDHAAKPETRDTPEVVAPLAQPTSPDSGVPDPNQKHEAFAMSVEPDGTAHIHDRRNLHGALGMPTERGARDLYHEWQATLARAYSHDNQRDQEDERPIEHPIGSIGATILEFDITDWAMRAHGDDPYASAKLAQLDATRALRMQAGARYREKELAVSGTLMARNLEQLWTTVPDVAERKRQLFALWDECSETGSDDAIKASIVARARVIAFIRTHLPAGSHAAFTPEELAALNRDKQSHEQFAPYAE